VQLQPFVRRGGWPVLVGAALVAVAVLGARARRTGATGSSPARAAVTISTVTARRGDIGVYISAIGTVTPVYTSTITSQVSGMITAVHYRESQVVRKGDPLIDIDSRPYQAQLRQAQGVLARDTHVLEQSRMDLERYREAWTRDAIAKQTLDDQEKLVQQNEGAVQNDQGTVDYEQVLLSWCHITAPYDGRVGLRLVDPGNVVQANSPTPLVVVTAVQPITVVFTVAEDHLGEIQSQLRLGGRLRVNLLDREQSATIASGVLLALDNQIDTTTGTVRLRAQFDNTQHKLFPNQFVNTRLLVRTQHGAVLVPSSAIQHNGRKAFVYIVEDGAVRVRAVTAGVEDGGVTATEGVQAGDVLANSSFERLQDSTPVRIAPESAP